MASHSSPPAHIAIIMDGNGRWAQLRGCGRTRGHQEGAKRVDEIVTECCRLGIRYLTLYAFSTENWSRPRWEVNMLMRLLVRTLRVMDKKMVRNQVTLAAQGTLERLPKYVQRELKRVMKVTKCASPRMTLNLALSYGGRQELVDAMRAIATKVAGGQCHPSHIDEYFVRQHLYQPSIPDPDLLIRTGGEYRVSNFLLWEIAYTEFYVSPVFWPDFNAKELWQALETFAMRQRRFGKTAEQLDPIPIERTPASLSASSSASLQ